MKRIISLLVGAILWAVPVTALWGQGRDPAALLPARTLAYLEVRHPEELSLELAGLMKGSALENMPATFARFRGQHPANPFWFMQEVAMFSLLLSPETLAEVGRVESAALAVTGFTKDQEPEVVGFVLKGGSNAPTFFLRAYLSIDNVHIVDEVEKIPLYRAQDRFFQPVGGGGAPPGNAKETVPTFALLPDAIVIGSTTECVRDVVLRYKDKPAGPTLGGTAAFQEAARLRGPGLFAFAACGELTTAFDALQKDRPLTDYEWSAVKAFANPKSVRYAAASLTLKDGALDLRAEAALLPGQSSPLLQLIANKPVNLSLLHAAPLTSLVAVTMSFPDGDAAWQTLLGMADTLAKLQGKPDNLWPSKGMGELEKQLKLRIGKDLFAKIASLALAYDTSGEAPTEGMRLPLVVIEATSEAAGKELEQAGPQLLSLMSRKEAVPPTREKVEGYTIQSLSGDGLPWGTTLHFGRQGAVIVFGHDRQAVVRALQGFAKGGGLLSKPKVAEAVRKLDKAVVLGVWSLPETVLQLMDLQGRQATNQVLPGAPPAAQPRPGEEGLDAKFGKELLKAMEPLPAAAVAVLRQPDRLTLEIRQPQLRSVSAGVIDLVVQWALEDVHKKAAGLAAPT